MKNDPLLQPFSLRHLELKNRILSTSHEPAYSEAGMPTDRYIAYHAAKADGGIALTMIGGSASVALDSPPAFGNLDVATDAIVPHFRRIAEAMHARGCAIMTQLTHMGRRTGHYTADWLPIVSPSAVREPAHQAFPKIAEDHDIRRIIRASAMPHAAPARATSTVSNSRRTAISWMRSGPDAPTSAPTNGAVHSTTASALRAR